MRNVDNGNSIIKFNNLFWRPKQFISNQEYIVFQIRLQKVLECSLNLSMQSIGKHINNAPNRLVFNKIFDRCLSFLIHFRSIGVKVSCMFTNYFTVERFPRFDFISNRIIFLALFKRVIPLKLLVYQLGSFFLDYNVHKEQRE